MANWALSHGVRIGGVVVVALFVLVVVRRLLPEALALATRGEVRGAADGPAELPALTTLERDKRLETLCHVLVRTVDVLVLLIAALLVLGEAGFSIAPLLAGAGIAGIAIGFGAQSLVRDLISGLFILVENQFARGDVVNVAGLGGVVEVINLRRTVLRDLDGVLHSVPNGEIRIASNLTRSWSRVNLDVSVGYREELSHVRSVIDRVGRELAEDPRWGPLILETPQVLRVDAFRDSGIALKVLATTRPMKQWDVAGQLRERIKAAFDAEGIQMPYPHRVVVVRHEEGAASRESPAHSDETSAPKSSTSELR